MATDLSAPARHAVERAFDLADRMQGELFILHVTHLSKLDSVFEALGEDLSQAKAALNRDAYDSIQLLTRDTSINRGVVAHSCVTEGNPLQTIATFADDLEVDLMVLGARGESFLRHHLVGSTATRLLRTSSHQPALIVKQAVHQRYCSVLVAVDFSSASLAAIMAAKCLAPEAEIVLFHAFELPYEGKLKFAGVQDEVLRDLITNGQAAQRQKMHELAAKAGLNPKEYSVRVMHGNPAQQIIAAEQEVDADLIVVGKHGSQIVEELLIGSVTKHVLAESQCDVLVIPDFGGHGE